MSLRILSSLLILTCVGCGWVRAAQITIENPKNLPIKGEEVSLLYMMVCQQVAENFHVPNSQDIQFPLTVVLGAERERYVIDHITNAGTIYLERWDELHFASAAVMIAFHHVLSNERANVIVIRALKRFSKVAPETVQAARNQR